MAAHPIARCRVTPLPGSQVAFAIDGVERLRWHFGKDYPRPFFYPFIGPAGESLTRMGHPGAADHDHHRSVWFAHADVGGIDFWSDHGKGRIVQQTWRCYEDGEEEAVMAVKLSWQDGTSRPVMTQDLVAAIQPQTGGEWTLELQSRFDVVRDPVILGRSNFGLLGVRMAKTISSYFGRGIITNSEGDEGESGIFGKYARWMDYSGPVSTGVEGGDSDRWNGITYIDHRDNPGYPAHWHVREDGWMGASVSRLEPVEITKERPLHLRYLLHVHDGRLESQRANQLAAAFDERAPFRLRHRPAMHREYGLERQS